MLHQEYLGSPPTIHFWNILGYGPTGPTGIELSGAEAYDPAIASTYSVGQVVTYEGGTYIVDSAPPLGTPDTSPDYTLLAAPGATGSTGSTGSAGPTGETGITGSG